MPKKTKNSQKFIGHNVFLKDLEEQNLKNPAFMSHIFNFNLVKLWSTVIEDETTKFQSLKSTKKNKHLFVPLSSFRAGGQELVSVMRWFLHCALSLLQNIFIGKKCYSILQRFEIKWIRTQFYSELAVDGAFGSYSEASGGRLASLAYTPPVARYARPYSAEKNRRKKSAAKKK